MSSVWRTVHHASIDSTQLEARRWIEAGETLDRVALSAGVQTGGVGRRGRAFASEAGGAWQTLCLRDGSGRWRDGRVAPAFAAFVADALARRGRPVWLKWPNDVWYVPLDGAASSERADAAEGGLGKAGGILIDHVRGHLLIGVGLNARNDPPAGAVALDLAPEEALEAGREAADRLVRGGLPDDIGAAWRARHLLDGRTVTVGGVRGRVDGVARDGGLRLVAADGTVRTARTGTVEAIRPPLRTG